MAGQLGNFPKQSTRSKKLKQLNIRRIEIFFVVNLLASHINANHYLLPTYLLSLIKEQKKLQ